MEIADDGPGIPTAVRARIFEPFFSTRAGGEGTGLGLSIAKRIVGDHLGTIDLDCPPGGGTVFRIELPIAGAAEPIQSASGGGGARGAME